MMREVQIAERKLRVARTNPWIQATMNLVPLLALFKAELLKAQDRLAAFDKDVGND